MKSVYIETSVVSYYTGRASRDVIVAGHQQSTLDFWTRLGTELSPFISALVLKEAAKGDPEVAKRRLDVLASFPVLQTTSETRMQIRHVAENAGYACPEIVSPDAFLGGEV